MQRLLLIDGNSLFHRAYHALPPLTDKNGEMANAVFGFSNMLLKAIGEVKPDYIACAFDTKAPTFRHIEFEKYKAQRVAPPPDLYPQLPKVKKVLDAFGIPYFEKEGYEADDIIATIAVRATKPSVIAISSETREKQSKKKNQIASSSFDKLRTPRNDKVVDQVIILSGDRDILQLVDGNIKAQMPGWNLTTTTLFGRKEVIEKYGIEPRQMVDYKSLTGDPSDNVPGVAGIGPKTACWLLNEYGSFENMYKNINFLPPKIAQKLATDSEQAALAKKLATIVTDAPITLRMNECLCANFDTKGLKDGFEKLGFKSLIKRLDSDDSKENSLLRQLADSEGQAKGKKEKEKNQQLVLL